MIFQQDFNFFRFIKKWWNLFSSVRPNYGRNKNYGVTKSYADNLNEWFWSWNVANLCLFDKVLLHISLSTNGSLLLQTTLTRGGKIGSFLKSEDTCFAFALILSRSRVHLVSFSVTEKVRWCTKLKFFVF